MPSLVGIEVTHPLEKGVVLHLLMNEGYFVPVLNESGPMALTKNIFKCQ